MTNRIGDRPRFPLSNQRFDKGDAENIARYYEEIISRFTGSIYGQAWGFMSNPGFYMESAVVGVQTFNYIKLNKCVLLHSVPADNTLNTVAQDTGPWNAVIAQYDPARAGQALQALTTNSAFSANQRPWILFRRSEAATNTGNKAYWDTDSNTEEVGAAPLQDSEYVEFRLSTTYSSGDRGAGWYRCAYIDSWGSPASAATPVIVPVHWMDSQYYADSTPPVQGTRVASALAHPSVPALAGLTGFNPTTEMPELTKLLHWMVGKLGEHYSTSYVRQVTSATAATYNLKEGAFVTVSDTGGWLSNPSRGLLELDVNMSDVLDYQIPLLTGRLNTNDATWSNYRRTTRLLHTLYIKPVSPGTGAEWGSYTFSVTALTDTTYSNSFCPTLGTYTGTAPAPTELRYLLTPSSAVGSAEKLLTVDLVAGSSFVVSSASAEFAADEARTSLPSPDSAPTYVLKYAITGSYAMPPAANVKVLLNIKPFAAYDAMELFPIVLHIYGRNV
jgi:hypothetical protein